MEINLILEVWEGWKSENPLKVYWVLVEAYFDKVLSAIKPLKFEKWLIE